MGASESSAAEDPESCFHDAVEEFHQARAEGRTLDMLGWLAVAREALRDGAGTAEAAPACGEVLIDCEFRAASAASAALAALSKTRRSSSGEAKAKAKAESKQIRASRAALGLEVSSRSGGSVGGRGGSSSIGGKSCLRGTADDCASGLPTAKRREAALAALHQTCEAAAVLDEETLATLCQGVGRCSGLGAGGEAAVAYGKALRRLLGRQMEAAVEPLERREATRKQLGKMAQRRSKGNLASEGAGAVEIDDSADPTPHYTGTAMILSAASVALHHTQNCAALLPPPPAAAAGAANAAGAAMGAPESEVTGETGDSPASAAAESLRALLLVVAQDASARARRIVAQFKAECALEQRHLAAVDWLRSLKSGSGGGGSTGSESEDGDFPAAGRGLDLLSLDDLLARLAELTGLFHRFLAFLGTVFDAHIISELPLFADALGLAAFYNDLETAYLVGSLHRAISQATVMEVRQGGRCAVGMVAGVAAVVAALLLDYVERSSNTT